MSELEWVSDVPDFGTLLLKGALPGGYPTETWLNDDRIQHDPDGSAFAWAVEEGVPAPIYWMDRLIESSEDPEARCWTLRKEIENWDLLTFDLNNSQASRVRCAAFAQHGRQVWQSLGCGDPLPIKFARDR